MVREPVHLSDWIQYLISKKNIYANWIIGDISAAIVILSIILLLIFNYGLINGMIISIPLLVLFFLILYLAFGLLPDFKKISRLLKDIMEEKKTDVNKIKEEWFMGRGLILEKERYKIWKNRIGWMTFILLIFDLISLSLGIYYNINPMLNLFQFLITVTLAFLSLYFAFHAIVIAYDSDDKINNIANSNFLSLLSRFEDRRLDLQFTKYPQERKYVNVTIWKAFDDLKEMKELLEFCEIKEKYQRMVINLQCQLLRIINRGVLNFEGQDYRIKELITCEAVSHLLQMNEQILDTKYNFVDLRNELFGYIRELFDEPETNFINEIYISKTIPILNEIIGNRLEEQRFLSRIDDVKTRARLLIEEARR